MSYTTRLVNPTPLHVSWNYHRGIVLEIEPFSYLDLNAQMMEQFMPDQPGADGISQEMSHHGVFLQDANRTYESQAEEAIKAAIKVKSSLYDDCEKGTRKRAADSGNLKEDAIQVELDRCGYSRLKQDVVKLQETLDIIQKAAAKNNRPVHQQYDPDRTLLFTNPPKVFPSPLAMRMFLAQPENSELRMKQEKFTAQMNAPSVKKAAEKTSEKEGA